MTRVDSRIRPVVSWTENKGEFHDQGDAKLIVIRGQLKGHNDMLAANPQVACWPPGGWPPSGRIWYFKLLLISNIIF
jgi:hypothetical protein